MHISPPFPLRLRKASARRPSKGFRTPLPKKGSLPQNEGDEENGLGGLVLEEVNIVLKGHTLWCNKELFQI